VVSEFFDGAMEVVEARIRGETDQTVVVIAHLCHPVPSAHDNGSGSAAAMEAACALQRLIDVGSIPVPRRSIRFLWVPEFSGTYAYCADHESELDDWIAGLNLDMVGADQERTGSIFMLERPPEAMASFAPDLLERLREELFDDVADLGSSNRYPLFRYGVTSFTGGSDHTVLSDPTVGVPTPMLIQWPDRYWHTSADTVDKVDPQMLGRAAVLAAAFSYWLTTAGQDEAYWLAQEMTSRFDARLTRRAQAAIGEGLWAKTVVAVARVWNNFLRQTDFALGRQLAALASLQTLVPAGQLSLHEFEGYAESSVESQKARVRSAFLRKSGISDLDELAPLVSERDAWQDEAAGLVPRRLYRGPVSVRAHLPALSAEDRLSWYQLAERGGGGWKTVLRLAEFWCDGQRSLADVVNLVELESGRRPGVDLLERFRLLEAMGLMELDRGLDAQA
jgi:hypothetical protein